MEPSQIPSHLIRYPSGQKGDHFVWGSVSSSPSTEGGNAEEPTNFQAGGIPCLLYPGTGSKGTRRRGTEEGAMELRSRNTNLRYEGEWEGDVSAGNRGRVSISSFVPLPQNSTLQAGKVSSCMATVLLLPRTVTPSSLCRSWVSWYHSCIVSESKVGIRVTWARKDDGTLNGKTDCIHVALSSNTTP